MIKLFTIGFTKKSAERFFRLLKENNVKEIVDIRISNSSQLAGFAKADDLKYFAETIAGITYRHLPEFAPTGELMHSYRGKQISWQQYEKEYLKLLKKRNVSDKFSAAEFDKCCFLCSEDTPDRCHRRLLAEYFQKQDKSVQVIHLI